MINDSGWICLHRKTLDSFVFQNEGLFKVWVWCLMKANHQTKWVPFKTGRGSSVIEVGPGQFIFGRKTAAKELKMKMSTVWDRMKILRKHQNLDMLTNSHYTLITIINWNAYQDKKLFTDRQADNHPTTNRQPTDTNNNDNNYNNDNNIKNTISLEAKKTASKPAAEKPILTIPLLAKKDAPQIEYPIHQQMITDWAISYPAVDILQTLHIIRQWNIANPKNRKTESGILRHINSWLAKEQNSAGTKPKRWNGQGVPARTANNIAACQAFLEDTP